MNEIDNANVSTSEVIAPPKRRASPVVLSVIGSVLVLSLVLLGWYLLGSRISAGKPVPVPRASMEETPSEPMDKTLTLSSEQIKNAGVTLETVGEQLSTESVETSATGTVEANAYKQIPAVTLVGGIIRRVIPELGQSVKLGDTVAIIFSDEYAQTQSRYIAQQTEAANARRNYERTQRLITINAPGRSELEEATKQRKSADAALSEMRSRYDRTTRLLNIGAASREELEQDNTKLRSAEAELEQARLKEARSTQLLAISPEVRAANEEALNKLQTAETEVAATRQRLILYGMSQAKISNLRSASQVTSELAVPAPASGTVTSRAVNPGEVVESNKELIRVTDLSSVWVIAQVYERELGYIRSGSGASVSSDAFSNRLFRGTITYIDPQLDETTRTGKVRVEVANPGGELKLGMYVRIAFGALGNSERTVPVVPVGAIQNINGQRAVFVQTSDLNVFRLVPVRLGSESKGRVQVLEGITVGDKVVINGSFSLRAEWLKGQQGTEHQH